MSHIFTVQIAGVRDREQYEDALFEAGCDDALVVEVNGDIYLDFDRDAATFDEAVSTASRDIERAGAKVIRVMPTPE